MILSKFKKKLEFQLDNPKSLISHEVQEKMNAEIIETMKKYIKNDKADLEIAINTINTEGRQTISIKMERVS